MDSAKPIRQSIAMRQGLHRGIHVAGLKAREFVHLVNEAHRRPALIRWSAVELVAGVSLFGGGVCLGTLLRWQVGRKVRRS
jgi:hypothetical protein